MEQTSQILGLLAQTSIHAGTGQQTGVIDLPIQREGHNGYPCIFGSAVKGALRARAEQQKIALLKQGDVSGATLEDFQEEAQKSDEIAVVYGPAPGASDITHAGAVIVTDARLLLFPVRSLTSQFKWVTCPAVIRRYQADLRRLGCPVLEVDIPEPVDSDDSDTSAAIVPMQSSEDDLFLEEYRFSTSPQDMSGLIKSLAELMGTEVAAQSLGKQLVIVSDDSFTHIVRHATPVNAHISIDSVTKLVRDGALWYEETLPPETLLYVGLSANDGRKAGARIPADQVLNHVTELFADKPWLQLGGNETVGMGWCSVSAVNGEG